MDMQAEKELLKPILKSSRSTKSGYSQSLDHIAVDEGLVIKLDEFVYYSSLDRKIWVKRKDTDLQICASVGKVYDRLNFVPNHKKPYFKP